MRSGEVKRVGKRGKGGKGKPRRARGAKKGARRLLPLSKIYRPSINLLYLNLVPSVDTML